MVTIDGIKGGCIMTEHEMITEFEENESLFLEPVPLERQLSPRKDLHAFLLLDRLVPSSRDIVSGAEHDKIFLQPSLEELAKVITIEQIQDLVRCGVRIEEDGLEMFA